MLEKLKHIPPIYISSLIAVVALFLLNHVWGSTYVGIDNISPFWGIGPVVAQIHHTADFFTFGPILFSWWFFILDFLHIAPNFISVLYVWGYLFISLCGYYWLVSHIQRKERIDSSTWIFPLVFFSSLVPLWIFSTHELMFMSLFTAFPYIYMLLCTWEQLSIRKRFFLILFFVPLFFSSSTNLVVFILGYILLLIFCLIEKLPIKRILTKWILLGVTFLAITQLLILATRGPILITTELQTHLSALTNSPEMQQITDDLQKGEKQNASVTNSLRFATGWLALFNPNGQYLFPWASIYRHNYIIASTQIITILLAIFLTLKYSPKKQTRYIILFCCGVLILSTLGVTILLSIPYVGVALRSTATKLWPLIFIPYLLFCFNTFLLLHKKNNLLTLVTSLALLIPAFPWVTGAVYSGTSAAIIPAEYSEFYSKLSESDRVAIFPAPQAIYFRKYSWGYYGSDLVSYMTEAKVIDGSSLSVLRIAYTELTEELNACTLDKDKWTNLSLIIEKNISLPSSIENCIRINFSESRSFASFTVYKVKSN